MTNPHTPLTAPHSPEPTSANEVSNRSSASVQGRPTGRPFDPGRQPTFSPVSGPAEPIAPAKDTSVPSTSLTFPEPRVAHRSIRRIGAQQLQRLGADLSAADRGVLDELAVHRFLSTHHLHDFCYRERSDAASTRANRRTVARLTRLGLIRPVIPRRVGGVRGGAAPGVWQLTEAGHRLQSDTVRRHRVSEPGLRLLDHTLAIAETHLAVLAAAHTMNGQTDITIEDAARRTMPTVGGGQRFLRPDLAVRITASDEEGAYEDAWFIEVDCGTESITTLLAKAAAYQDYYNLGIEQHRHEGNFPLVLWVIHGHRADERLHALRSGIAARTRLADHLFRYATPATLAATLQSGGEQ